MLALAMSGPLAPAQAQICGPAVGGGVGCTNALGPVILANGGTLPGNIVYVDPLALTINLSGGITIPSVGIGVLLTTGLEGTINVSGGVNNLAAGIGYSVISGGVGTINVSSGAQTVVGGIGYSVNAGGAATVNISSGVNTVAGGVGVQVAALGIAVVNVSTGANITAGGVGISANGVGLTTVSFDGELNAIGVGIQAAAAGSVTVQTSNRASIAVVGVGIRADASGDLFVFSSGTIDSAAAGIQAANTSGSSASRTQVSVGGRITAGEEAVRVESNASAVSVSIGGAVTGGTEGVIVRSQSGAVSLGANSTIVGQGGHGIDIDTTSGNASVNVTSTVRSDAFGDALRITSDTGDVRVVGTITSQLTSAAGDALFISTGGNVTIDQDGRLTALAGIGIHVDNSGSASIVSETAITAGSHGIDVRSSGAIDIDQTITALIMAGGDGIRLGSTGGPITLVQNGQLTVGRDGIVVTGTGGAAMSTIYSNVAISAPRNAISAEGGVTGPLTINANAALTGQGGRGIDITGAGNTANVTANLNAPVFGDIAAVRIDTTGTAQVTVAAGVSVSSNPANDRAIEGTLGNFFVFNSGVVTGSVLFGPSQTAFNNNAGGIWFTHSAGNAGSTSDFGGADSTINNRGAIVAARDANIIEQVFFNGLANFNNGDPGGTGLGLLTMQDGQVGDRLTTPGIFTGVGNSQLAIDAFLGPPGSIADVLVVGQATAGSTAILVNNTNAGPGSYNPVGIEVVDVSAGTTAASHFFLPNGPIKRGLFTYDLLLRPDNIHVLAGVPDQEVFEMPRILSAAQALWYENAVIWYERQNDLRDRMMGGGGPQGQASRGGVWAQAWGTLTRRDDTARYTLYNGNYLYDTSYSQQTGGIVGGIDGIARGLFGGNDALTLGVLGGYTTSELEFTASRSGTTVQLEGGSVGGYATYLNGRFFADALVKGDIYNLDYRSNRLAPFGGSDAAGAFSIGTRIDTGFKFGGTRFFVEPLASVAYVATSIDNIAVGGSTVDFEDAQSLRGRLGMRIGGEVARFTNATLGATVTGSVWQEFLGDNSVRILSAGPVFTTTDHFDKTYGTLAGTIDIGSFTGYIKGDVTYSEDFLSGQVSIGQRFRW